MYAVRWIYLATYSQSESAQNVRKWGFQVFLTRKTRPFRNSRRHRHFRWVRCVLRRAGIRGPYSYTRGHYAVVVSQRWMVSTQSDPWGKVRLIGSKAIQKRTVLGSDREDTTKALRRERKSVNTCRSGLCISSLHHFHSGLYTLWQTVSIVGGRGWYDGCPVRHGQNVWRAKCLYVG